MNAVTDTKTIRGFIRRRKKSFIITFSLFFIVAVCVAIVWPPTYLSEAIILIEGQQIPEAFVKPAFTGSFIEERLEVIEQQITNYDKLTKIIDEYNLFPELRDRNTMEQIVAKMRDKIKVQKISATVPNQKTGRSSAATIAFSLSYEGKNPAAVYNVANKLTSLFIEEDLRTRQKLVSATTDFLQQEIEQLNKKIHDQTLKISQFKERHIGELPENINSTLQSISRLEVELDKAETRIRSLREKKIYLQGRLANIDPLLPIVTEDGKVSQNPTERLKSLRLKLSTLQSTLSPKHPDIKKLKREIKELESQVGRTDTSSVKIKRLEALKGILAEMKGRKGPKHPDVLKVSREIDALSKEVKNLKADKTSFPFPESKPDNPVYVNLKTQIEAADIEMQGIQQQMSKIKADLEKYLKRSENAPFVEKEYNALKRDLNNLNARYDDLSSKLLTAKVAGGMEETQRGEKFTISESPRMPEKPFKPNRLALVLLGFVIALGAGVGLATIRESMDKSIKSRDELSKAVGVPVYSVMPIVVSEKERRAMRLKRVLWVSATVCAILAALMLVNSLVMPLDILWLKLQNKIIA